MGFCTKCNKKLGLLSVVFGKTKLINNQVFCSKCAKEYEKRLFPTPQEAEKIKKANKLLWLRYFEANGKIYEEKVNILRITSESITGYSHNRKGIKKIYYDKFIDWKMLDEYAPGKEPFLKTEGTELYDTYAENAIQLNRRMWIKYKDFNGEISKRKVDIYYSKYGYFHGWCHLRNEARSFKIDGVKEWKLLDEIFNRDPMVDIYLKAKQDRNSEISNLTYAEWIQQNQ